MWTVVKERNILTFVKSRCRLRINWILFLLFFSERRKETETVRRPPDVRTHPLLSKCCKNSDVKNYSTCKEKSTFGTESPRASSLPSQKNRRRGLPGVTYAKHLTRRQILNKRKYSKRGNLCIEYRINKTRYVSFAFAIQDKYRWQMDS